LLLLPQQASETTCRVRAALLVANVQAKLMILFQGKQITMTIKRSLSLDWRQPLFRRYKSSSEIRPARPMNNDRLSARLVGRTARLGRRARPFKNSNTFRNSIFRLLAFFVVLLAIAIIDKSFTMNTKRPPNNTPHRDLSELRGKAARLTPQFSSIQKTTTISDQHDATTTPRRRKPALCHERLQFRTNSQSKRNHSFLESSPIAVATEDGDRFIPHRAVATSASSKGHYEFDGFQSNAHKHHNAKSLSKDKRDRFLYQLLIVDDYYERIS
jgi:hypothetical protein